jgi:hypothetical protein
VPGRVTFGEVKLNESIEGEIDLRSGVGDNVIRGKFIAEQILRELFGTNPTDKTWEVKGEHGSCPRRPARPMDGLSKGSKLSTRRSHQSQQQQQYPSRAAIYWLRGGKSLRLRCF